MAIATLSDNEELKLLALEAGEIWTSERGLAHNVFMPASVITHTVKHGTGSEHDWLTNSDTELLDKLTQKSTQAELENLLFG